MHVCKLVAIGYDPCLGSALVETWTAPATMVFAAAGDTETFAAPTYQNCGVQRTDLAFEFYDTSLQQSGSLSWISINSSQQITVAPQQTEINLFQG